MEATEKTVEFHQRVKQVRKIARTIFDKVESEVVMRFLGDCENMAEKNQASAGK